MKKLILLSSFGLLGSFAFANNEIVKVNENDSVDNSQNVVKADAASECCTVTVDGGDGSATVTKCRATRAEACAAAYAAAFEATE